MLKKLVLMVGLCGAASINHAGPVKMISKTFDWGFKQLSGYREISPKYYPKTVAYLDGLRAKYPEAFDGIEFLMSRHASFGPAAAVMTTVFISDKMIKKIEAEDAQTLAAFEFVLLHEAGHVRHYDIMKRLGVLVLFSLASWKVSQMVLSDTQTKQTFFPRIMTWSGYEQDKALQQTKVTTAQQIAGATSIASILLFEILMSRLIAEPGADDYACDHCDNPQALKDGALFFDKIGSRGWFADLAHPTIESRIEKIKDAFKKKFGEEMPE